MIETYFRQVKKKLGRLGGLESAIGMQPEFARAQTATTVHRGPKKYFLQTAPCDAELWIGTASGFKVHANPKIQTVA